MTRFFLQSSRLLLLVSVFASLLSCGDSEPKGEREGEAKKGIKKKVPRADWREVLERPEISQEEFVQAYIDALAEIGPGSEVELGEEELTLLVVLDGNDIESFLHNAWRDTESEPGERVDRCERHWKAVLETLRDDRDGPPDRSTIIPVIKTIGYVRDIRDMREEESSKEDPFYYEELVADLVVMYAKDSELQISLLTSSVIDDLELERGELRKLAIANLLSRIDEIKLHGSGPAYALVVGQGFEANLLLLDEVWEEKAAMVDGDLVVAVPSRDLMLFTGSDSAVGISKVREIVATTHEDGSYLISETLLVRKDSAWVPFTE